MPTTVPDRRASGHLNSLDIRPTPAKAELKNLELRWREQIGRAIQRCFSLAGLTQKEAAALVDRDQAQVARWIAGAERAPLDVLFGVEQLRAPLVVALAELAGQGVEVRTQITIRREVA